MQTLKTLVAISTLGLTSLALGQPTENPFDEIDSDGNGTVSFAEFQEMGLNPLSRIDSNDDGAVSLDEFLNGSPRRSGKRGGQQGGDNSTTDDAEALQRAEMRTARMTEQFYAMDLDGDELISVSEFQEATFLRMDRDNNGALTMEEMRPSRGRGERRRGGPRGAKPDAV